MQAGLETSLDFDMAIFTFTMSGGFQTTRSNIFLTLLRNQEILWLRASLIGGRKPPTRFTEVNRVCPLYVKGVRGFSLWQITNLPSLRWRSQDLKAFRFWDRTPFFMPYLRLLNRILLEQVRSMLNPYMLLLPIPRPLGRCISRKAAVYTEYFTGNV